MHGRGWHMGFIDSIKKAISPAAPPKVEPVMAKVGEQVAEAVKGHAETSDFKAAQGPTVQEAAEANYGKTGDHVFDLKTELGREGLVVQSPQLDNIPGGNDKTRCGAACVVDSLILDGDHVASANALQKLADDAKARGASFSKEQTDAIAALRAGKMTSTQAAHLQELVYESAKTLPMRTGEKACDGAGITPNGMASLVAHLKTAGALKNCGNVSMTAEVRQNEKGQPYNHWTLTRRDKTLYPTHVDPWPNQRGQKSLKHEEPSAMPSWDSRANKPNDKFLAEVNLQNGEKDSLVTIRTRGGYHDGKAGYLDVRATLPKGAKTPPGPLDFQRTFRDKDTHEPIAEL